MLVLDRRMNGVIEIDPEGLGIEIVVVRVGNGRVKLGIHAPKHIKIRRKELASRPRGDVEEGEE